MIGKLWGWLYGQPETPKSKIVEPPMLAPETQVYVPPPMPEPVIVPTEVIVETVVSAPAEEIKTAVTKNTKPKRNNARKNAVKKSK